MARTVLRLVAAGVVALVLGVLTAYAQGWLPTAVAPFANSAGPWCVVAFLLAGGMGSQAAAAGCGVLTLGALLTGYLLRAELAGNSSSKTLILFWSLAAIAVGPVVGLGAYWVRRDTSWRAAVGGAIPAGLLIGEAIYGLRSISDTTSRSYWWVEATVGLGIMVVLAVTKLRQWTAILLAVGTAAGIAVALVLAYQLDLIAYI